MGRRPKTRQIKNPPLYNVFKPQAVPSNQLLEVALTLGEYEAIRLCDYEGLNHEEGAKQMQISRPTFTRVLEAAHKKISTAIVEGRAIRIEGGNYQIAANIFRCLDCGYQWEGVEHSDNCPRCNSINIICLGSSFGMCQRKRCRHGRR